MKKIILCFIFLAFVLIFPAEASAIESSEWKYKKISDTEIEITEYVGTETNIVFPTEIAGYPVTSIEGDCFKQIDKSTLKSIYIPYTITNIDAGITGRCSELESIIVDERNHVYDSRNNSNTIIETSSNKLVAGCKTSDIPSDVISLGEKAFYYQTKLSSIIIPEGVETIEKECFFECRNLKEVFIPESIKNIKENNFFVFDGTTSPLGICYYSGTGKAWNTINRQDEEFALDGIFWVRMFNQKNIVPKKKVVDGIIDYNGIEYKLNKDKTATVISVYGWNVIERYIKVYSFKYTVTGILPKSLVDSKASVLWISSNIRKIPSNTFKYNKSFDTLIFSSGLKSITFPKNVFKGMNSLKKVVLSGKISKVTFKKNAFGKLSKAKQKKITLCIAKEKVISKKTVKKALKNAGYKYIKVAKWL